MRCKTNKNEETRRETKKKWGDETRAEKKTREMRRETKKMGRQDARQKKWGDET